MHAYRNLSICTKDCLCLYVCPTGATDTETGQIDFAKCIDGCRKCVDACPSNAISLVPHKYPPQQDKTMEVKQALSLLAKSKTKQESIAKAISKDSSDPITKQFASALNQSNRIIAEDVLRESGFMLPQSLNAQEFLGSLLEAEQPSDFPKEAVSRLIELLSQNNEL